MSKLKIIFLICLAILMYSNAENDVAIFVFGDSIFDPGNNNFINLSSATKADRWPYGETFFNFSTGRYCDGRIIPDFIAMNASLPPWKPYLQQNGTQKSFRHGANFAAGGAHAISENNPGWINLKEQLSFFKNASKILSNEVGEEEAKKILMEAVYMTSIGGDDFATFIGDDHPNSTQIQQFIDLVIGNITQVIMEIYDMGGRKFAIQNIGPMGCAPRSLQSYDVPSNECYEFMNDIIRQHNQEFIKSAHALENELQGFTFLIFDYFSSLYSIVKNASIYGFTVTDFACCGSGTNDASDCGIEPYELCSNPNEYVYFDGDHPGDQANLILSQLLWSGDSTVTTPINFKQLLELQIVSNIYLGYKVDHHHNVDVEMM
ncbi:GDSL lipase [Euphorbia peplus]|nr:GDSL lipase [Euphorbia peplus]